jgi:N-acetylglucosamine repressor
MYNLSRPDARLLGLLKVIHDAAQISKTDLVEQTGFSPFQISKMCDELLDSRFIQETGPGNSTGGRPPTLLSIDPTSGKLVGLHIGTFNARIVITDLAGTLLAFRKVRSLVETGPEAAIRQLTLEVDATLSQAGVARGQVRGIGVGISGVLDRATGTTLFWPKVPQWVNVPVKKSFSDTFGTLVEVEDTPRTMALAERRFGTARQASEYVYVSVGAGTGAALFLRDQIYTGANGFAGEFGHVSVDERGPLCSCGNHGCLEVTVSASTLIRRAQNAVTQHLSAILWRLSGGNVESISLELIGQAAVEGDRFSSSLLHEAGSFLGTGLVGIVNLLNPMLITLGGGLALTAGQFLLPAVEQVIRSRALEPQAAQVRVELSTLGEADWGRGAALLVTSRALEESFVKSRAHRQSKSKRPSTAQAASKTPSI